MFADKFQTVDHFRRIGQENALAKTDYTLVTRCDSVRYFFGADKNIGFNSNFFVSFELIYF